VITEQLRLKTTILVECVWGTKIKIFNFSLKSKLKFQFRWFERCPWLVYWTIDNGGAVCKYCVIFGQEFGGKGYYQKLSSLVNNIFNNWKHAIEVFSEHSEKYFDKTNVLRFENCIPTA